MIRFTRNKAEKRGEVLIYEDIGDGFFGGMSAKQFATELKGLGDIDNLDVRVNSPGGDVFAGIAIHNQIAQHPANVTVYVDGLAASAASIVAMAGDDIQIADNGLIMIHNAATIVWGDKADMRKVADDLEKIDGTLVQTYMKRTGNDEQQVVDWMDQETWFDAREAVDNGFATAIVGEDDIPAAASSTLIIAADRFRNPPKALAELVAAQASRNESIKYRVAAQAKAMQRRTQAAAMRARVSAVNGSHYGA